MPSIQETIAAGADDVLSQFFGSPGTSGYAFDAVAAAVNVSNFEYTGPGSVQRRQLGLRFQNIEIPQGATIDSAIISVTTQTLTFDGGVATHEFQWVGDDVADAAAWSANDAPRHITQTTAKSAFNFTAGALVEHDVTSIVQELVNGAWASGNAMRMVATHGGPLALTGSYATVKAVFSAYEASPAGTKQAILDVTYTEGGSEEPADSDTGTLGFVQHIGWMGP